MAHIEILTDSTPKYHAKYDAAVIRHNENGIRLWQRTGEAPQSVKPYATGDIPAWMIGYYYEEVPRS